MRQASIRVFFAVVSIIALSAIVGCATPSTPQAMTVQPGMVTPVNPSLKVALSVGEVSGGKETNPLWTSQVDNAGFKKALQDSLAIAGYLATNPAQAKYQVVANLKSLDQPFFGLTFDVKSSVDYRLTGQAVDRTFPVNATGTATTSDAFVGMERLRIANERSILENIKAFINELSKFNP